MEVDPCGGSRLHPPHPFPVLSAAGAEVGELKRPAPACDTLMNEDIVILYCKISS
ncbi:MAG: hypothetical protein JO031_15250 [Ktedonobacteraceae bacterium]|nr:hypothetical protein [Ktedonobacteraceae bacterium]